MMQRSRGLVFSLLLATVALGLASRRFGEGLPSIIATFAGDTLWAAAVYWGLALVLMRKAALWTAVVALQVSFAIELSQLYSAPWIHGLRASRIGGLVLGQGFLWSDFLCYFLGIVIAATVDILWLRRTAIPQGVRRG